ncbi:MAG: MFS transporter [Pseudomonadota bacterium]
MALSLGQKAGWGLADMGIVVFVIVKQLLILTYLTAFLGVPVGIAGFVTTAVLIFDMVTDPLVGYLSDRTQSRFGRRAPWMFFGVLVMSAGMVGLFAVPAGMGMAANIGWVVAFFGVATVGFTMVAIPYSAQSGEITQDPKERSTMTGFRMAFASVGILIGGALIPGLAEGRGYAVGALMVTPLMVGAVWISLFATRKAPRIEKPATVPLWDVFGLVFANRAFVVLVLLYGVMTLAVAMITAGLPFAAIYLINDTGDTPLSGAADALSVLSLMFAAFVAGSILSQAVWVMLSHRLGKVVALVLGLLCYIGLLYALYSVLPSINVTMIAVLLLIGGMTNGAYQQIPWAIYPDLMDVTRAESGVAIEGAFSAIWLFGQKLANAVAPALLGLMLASAGWQESVDGVVPQTDRALQTLQLSITLIPAAILAVAAVSLFLIYRPMARQALA